MTAPFLFIIALLGDVSSKMRTLADSLRSRGQVTRVDRTCDPRNGDAGPSVEWFVDAELSNGEALSWHLLVYWSENGWIIESEVRRVHAAGSDLEIQLETQRAGHEELSDALLAAADELVATVAYVGLDE